MLWFLAVGAVSCSKAVDDGPGAEGLFIFPVSTQTKAAVNGGALPENYTIWLSAYYNNSTAGESSDNYFTAEPFRKAGDRWSASPVIYWPMGGYLDFLALATENLDIRTHTQWYEDNVSRNVAVRVPELSCMDSEILYSHASSKKGDERCVTMNFSHTQAWLQFRLSPFEANTTRIDSIVVSKAYLGGTLRVDNGVFLSSNWDYHGYLRKDYTLPESRGLILEGPLVTINVLLPEQDACNIIVYYTQKDAVETSWDNYTRQTSYTHPANADPWYAGTRTVYTMTVQKHLLVSASIHDWEEDNRQIKIE